MQPQHAQRSAHRPPVVLVTATTEAIRGLPRVRVNEAYTTALASAGLVPLVLPPLAPELAVQSLTGVAGLVLTGGEDVDPARYAAAAHPATGAPHAARDAMELALACEARARLLPTLAICRGAQVINVAFGGTLVQDIASESGTAIDHDQPKARTERVHDVELTSGSALAAAVRCDRVTTNSSHHQSVDRLAGGLRVTALSPDGIIEGFESTDPDWWMLAVQWHPEELISTREDWDRRLFLAFAARCRATT